MNRSKNTKKNKPKAPLRGGFPEFLAPVAAWDNYLNAMVTAVDAALRPGVAAAPAVPAAPAVRGPLTTWQAVLDLDTRETQELKNAIIKGITSETTRLLSSAITLSNKIPPVVAAAP